MGHHAKGATLRSLALSLSIAVSTLLFISSGSAQQTVNMSVPNLVRYGGTLKDAQARLWRQGPRA